MFNKKFIEMKHILAVVWIPIILFTVITGKIISGFLFFKKVTEGYMVRNVAVGSRVDDAAGAGDVDSNIRIRDGNRFFGIFHWSTNIQTRTSDQYYCYSELGLGLNDAK